jgi:hypothetical protein
MATTALHALIGAFRDGAISGLWHSSYIDTTIKDAIVRWRHECTRTGRERRPGRPDHRNHAHNVPASSPSAGVTPEQRAVR